MRKLIAGLTVLAAAGSVGVGSAAAKAGDVIVNSPQPTCSGAFKAQLKVGVRAAGIQLQFKLDPRGNATETWDVTASQNGTQFFSGAVTTGLDGNVTLRRDEANGGHLPNAAGTDRFTVTATRGTASCTLSAAV